MYTVSPRYSELFALSMLMMHVKGPTSFEDVRTLDDGTVCDTFVEAARVSKSEHSVLVMLLYCRHVD